MTVKYNADQKVPRPVCWPVLDRSAIRYWDGIKEKNLDPSRGRPRGRSERAPERVLDELAEAGTGVRRQEHGPSVQSRPTVDGHAARAGHTSPAGVRLDLPLPEERPDARAVVDEASVELHEFGTCLEFFLY